MMGEFERAAKVGEATMYSRAIAFIGRRYPFLSGNFRIVNYSKISRVFAANDTLSWCSSPGGPLLVPLNDAVGRCIYFTGDYDRKITWLCRKLLRPGDIALDIGANLGVVTLAMARFVGPSGWVHCFEPNPTMQNLLSQSIARSYHNITLHPIALGVEGATLDLRVPSANIGAGSFINNREASDAEVIKCPIRRLADVISDEEITSVRLVKLDVEGFENEVLLGAGDLLSAIRPMVILETNETSRQPFREYPAIATLISNGYRFFAIPKALISMRMQEISVDRIGAPSHDVLAVPAQSYSEVLTALH
jgi:FkbM family methyltransferase